MITFKKHPLATLQRSVVPPRHAAAPGFTLVELLVALGLVSLLMLMFAQVFQVATGTMSTQRGIMENDQRARSLTTIIINDLKNRSMRHLLPYQPGEVAPDAAYNYPSYHGERFTTAHGFFSISENTDTNQNDDVLHFTMTITDPDADPYYGKATVLGGTTNLSATPNQPDADDAELAPNATASSSMAEIVYFLRNGNLYRRVLLIREPLVRAGADAMNSQPRDGTDGRGADYFNPLPAMPYYAFGRDFWNEFDFSGRMSSATAGVRFPGEGVATVYSNPLDNGAGTGFFPLAVPSYRFGHNFDTTSVNNNGTTAAAGPPLPPTLDDSAGYPREFLDSGTFIGRFTQEETSHSKFNYPHSYSSDTDNHDPSTGIPTAFINDGNPMMMSATTNALVDADADGVVDQYAQGPRRGEDLLLSNVHEFDVKVWDEIIGDYVDIGHSQSSGTVNGDFHQNRNRRQSYGPQSSGNRMLDTWHPGFNANNVGGVDINDEMPFLPKIVYANEWQPSTSYAAGATVVIRRQDYTSPNCENLRFVCTTAGTSGAAPPTTWTTAGTGVAVGSTTVDNTAAWQAIYNLKRVKSLKITIRYLDVTSDQMRQVTLIQSLLE